MKRVLVLGGLGMLGHEIVRHLSARQHTTVALRRAAEVWPATLPAVTVIGGVDLDDAAAMQRLLDQCTPDVVVNCVGIIKQKDPASQLVHRTNAELPLRLQQACGRAGMRLVHFSTDCVFSGNADPRRPDGYNEDHVPDPVDLYGRTKLAGEVAGPGCLTLRTSFIGREITSRVSLMEWLFSQKGQTISGYKRALYSGLSTTTAAALVADLIERRPDLDGLWHVGGEAISKFDLLRLAVERGELDIELTPQSEFACDRRLDSARFTAATGWRAPSWTEMVDQVLAQPAHALNERASIAIRPLARRRT
jgi:dTDP-4-dehydrorhamnose reductase